MGIVIDKILGTALMHDHGSSGGTALLLDGSNSPMTGSLGIEGSSDEVQLYVKGHSTQTSNYFEIIRNSDSVKLTYIDTNGHFNLANNTNNTPSIKFNPTGGNPPLYIYQRNLALTMGLNGNNVNRILAWFPVQGADSVWNMELQVYGNNSAFYPLYPSTSATNYIGRSTHRWNNVYSWRATIDQLTMGYNGDQSPAINMTLQSGQTADPINIKDNSSNNLIYLTATGGAVFNEQGNDADFRIEGDTDANLFMVDASTDRVGIGTSTPTAKLDINSDVFRLRTSKTPASATATGNAGDICWDSGYIYVCIATDTWERATLASW